MNVLKSKLLLNLAKKKNKNGGFTLIELLVVIIIIGVLSAIALPSLLSQTSKARQSEAKVNLGALIRGQQAYRLEQGTFADNKDKLDTSVQGKFYDYTVEQDTPAPSASVVNMDATENPDYTDDLKGYQAGAYQPAPKEFKSIICEDDTAATRNANAPDSLAKGATPDCSAGGVEVN